ncbi:MAG: AAA family ATPase [Candidatus Aminicenantes bacterium]|nr:AAA family ATPase [Candidatus Aminicenantes bacterium]
MTKISFSGCIGSGKSSLLTEVKKILSLKEGVESIEDISKKNPFDTDKKLSFISQFYLLTNHINEENIKAISFSDMLLCDSSVLDHWIQWQKHLSDIEMNNNIEEKSEILKKLYLFWIKTYDLIFFIRVDPKVLEKRKEEDSFTLPGMEYFKEMEALYLKTIKDDNLKIIEIWNNHSVDEGANTIVEHISEFQKK